MAVEEPCRSAISSWSLLSPGARHTSEPSGGSSPTHHLTTEGTLRENPQVYEVGEVREARWPAPELESSRRLQQLCDLSPDPSPCRSSIFHTIARCAGRWTLLHWCAPIYSPRWNLQPRQEDELWDPVPESPEPQLRSSDPETEWPSDHGERDAAREGTQAGGVGEGEAGSPLSKEPDVGLEGS
ncbi:brain and acute leukemia cytoplasmic protein isoform X5 [Mirounga angustirostris]|uniref:brain and acute leukemia cytoplasmic protein isoform X5 n=1 Tax=Mirounga angustirostris TaxID=9716 RepID=UPI00313E0871